MPKNYVSAVPLTMVRLVDGGYRNVLEGEQIAGEAVQPDDLKRLTRKGFLKEAPAPVEKSSGDNDGGSKEPGIKEILAEVGDDKEKAATALEAEKAKGDKARTSLVTKLEAIANPQS